MTTKPAAIFWDMDGTLIDSEPLWGIATYELSERMGRRLSPEVREQTVGGSLINTLEICANYAGVNFSDVDVEGERQRLYDRVGQLIGEIEPNPGVRELLDELLPLPMLVTTNTERQLADRSIDAVGRQFFVDSITGDEVANPKPAPDMYLEAARRVGVQPHHCLVFEDSWAGMRAAAAAGCVTIGLATKVPTGVCSMTKLAPKISFEGVGAAEIYTWFQALSQS